MRKILVGAALGAAMGLFVSTAQAGSEAPKKAAKAPAKVATAKVGSAKVGSAKIQTFDLHGVRWIRGLEGTRSHRKAAERPVLWLRVLGDPTGNT